jgi:hypothetical protein
VLGFCPAATTRARFAANVRVITIMRDPGSATIFICLRQRSGSTTLTILLHALTNLGAMAETVLRVEWLG